MVFLDWKAYPWYWSFTDHFWYAALLVVLVPGLLAFVFGFFAFRSRIKGVYFSIITQAMTFAFMLLFFRNDTGFGGNNGFTDFKRILGFPITAPQTRMVLFVLTGGRAARISSARSLDRTSKLGRVLTAIRDAETRVMFSGYNPVYFKLFIWTLSAVICGIAGALYVPQVGIINPSEMSPANSIEIAIWTAVGGRGTLVGPVLGAAVVNLGKSWFTQAFPEYWLFALGLLFILVDAVPAAGHRRAVGEVREEIDDGSMRTLADSRAVGRRQRRRRRAGHERRCRHQPQGHSLPRRHLGQLRRIQGAQRAVAADRRRRAALRDRAQRRGQDDDDGRHHRQDASRYGHGVFRADHRSHTL